MNITSRLTFCIILLAHCYSCSDTTSIEALCERDAQKNYILKWEIFPEMDKTPVDIYVSDNDSVFPTSPFMTVNSSDYIAVISEPKEEQHTRKYFKLKVGGVFSDVITNRFFEADSVQNFRDLGGYESLDGRSIRWGRIYRAGSFKSLSWNDIKLVSRLKVKTLIDIRPEDAIHKNQEELQIVKNIRIPIACDGYEYVTRRIADGNFKRPDAVIYMQDRYKNMVEDYTDAYSKLFDHLCDENNYPIIYYCYLGKDQTGLATYFLLKALDIPSDIIEDDYKISENYIDRTKVVKDADSLSEPIQEAWTLLTQTDLSYLKYALSCIREKSGSIDNYMLNELKLTPDKKEKLKRILLH